MNTTHNGALSANAQDLRKNMTKEERHLWYDFLKDLPLSVKRQKIFGRYIVDFYVPDKKLVIELDGTQHFEADGLLADKERDRYLLKLGLSVTRYSNKDINENFENVCNDILKRLGLL